jgi:Ala-tRNA(Pro) deacylase
MSSAQRTDATSAAMTTTGSAAVVEYLEGRDVVFELIEHEPTMSAAAEARVTRQPHEEVAKTLILHDRGRSIVAVIPASERLDLHRLRDALGATQSLRLATEAEIARAFPMLEVGAAPPVGPVMPAAEVVDRRLLARSRIVCAGGDHRHAVVLDPRDLIRLTDATIADICAEDGRRA